MDQKPWIIQGGLVYLHHNVQDDCRIENEKRHHQHQHQLQQQQQQQHQQQHQQQQQHQVQHQPHREQHQHQYHNQHQHEQKKYQHQHQHHHQSLKYHNFHHVQHPSMIHSSTSNPTNRSNLAEPDKEHSLATTTRNFDNNNIPYSICNGLQIIAPAPNDGPSYQNQDALEQLENNLRLVLKQHPSKTFQQYQQPQGTIAVSGSGHSHKDATDNCDITIRFSEGHCNSDAPPISFQTKTLPRSEMSSSNSTAPSLTEERTSTNNTDGNSSNNNDSRPTKGRSESTPRSYSSQLPSPLPLPSISNNPTSRGLFALGDEFQPLSMTSQQKKSRHSSSPPQVSSNGLLGMWSEEAVTEETANDIFMNNLFHAELKMSRQKKSTDKDSKLKPPSTTSDSNEHRKSRRCSKIDVSLESLSSTSKHGVLPKQTRIDDTSHKKSGTKLRPPSPKIVDEDYNLSTGTAATLACKRLKDKMKKSRKKKMNNGLLSSKTKQKRKTSLKRKPKFPVLQNDPPIEEQILALPVIALPPSLLASIVTNDSSYNSTLYDAKQGGNCIRQTTTNIGNRKRKLSDTCCASEYDGNNDDDSNSPTHTFRSILKARNHNAMYSVEFEGTEYDIVPSPLQLASYGTYLVWAIQSSDSSLIRRLLGCGLSPNPCNQFRDSILGDLVCKQGNFPIYKCFVDEFHADLRIIDGFGRTLLHHCCWANELCRPMVEDILQRDPIQIFLKDKQDKTPLEYVRADAYGSWNTFLKEVANKYWPKGSELPQLSLPLDDRRLPNGDLIDPPKAVAPAVAAGVASGKIAPEEVSTINEVTRKKKGKQ